MTKQDLNKFFEEEVQEAIPAIIKEWVRVSGITDDGEYAKMMADSRVRCF